MPMFHRAATALIMLCASPALAPALAHVSLETGQAPANSTYRAVFRVPHGCGDAATARITVRLPDGVAQARPMPKAGWSLRVTYRGEPAPGHGNIADASVVVWEGGRLPNEHYDEFVIRLRLPDTPGQLLYIPVLQECEGGDSVDWAQIPEAGRRASEYPRLAPAVRLLPRN
jgi:uncharacterized protein YcnI